jgi:hypothetical protein
VNPGQFIVAVCRACLRREGLAFFALAISLGGAGVLSFFLYGNLLYFRQHGATNELFYISCGMLALISIVLISSHRLLGSKLAIEAEVLSAKLKIEQGDDSAP